MNKDNITTLRRKIDTLQKIKDNYLYHRPTAYPGNDNYASTYDCLCDFMDCVDGMQKLIYEIEKQV